MRKDDLDVGFIPMAPASPALPSSLGTSDTPAPLRQSPYRKIYLASAGKTALPVTPKISQPVQPPSNSSPLDSSLGISYPNPVDSSTSSADPVSPRLPIGTLSVGRRPINNRPIAMS